MLRPSPNHGTQRLPNDEMNDDDLLHDILFYIFVIECVITREHFDELDE